MGHREGCQRYVRHNRPDQPGGGLDGLWPDRGWVVSGRDQGRARGPGRCAARGHTGKASAKADEPSALDILGSGAWSHRARCCFVARAHNTHIELHLVKANYAPQGGSWAYTATPTGALVQVDSEAARTTEHAEDDKKVLEGVPAHPEAISSSALSVAVYGWKNREGLAKIGAALRRLVAAGHVVVNAKGDRWSTPKTTEGEE